MLSSLVRLGLLWPLRPHRGFPSNRWRKRPGHRRKGTWLQDVAARGSHGTVPGARLQHRSCALRGHTPICSSAQSTPVFWSLLSRWLTTDLEMTGLSGGCRVWSWEQPGAGVGGKETDRV